MNSRILYVLFSLGISTLACSPVIAISWKEFLIIGVLIAALLGPPLYRFVRRVEHSVKRKKKEE
jgi:hypothetical protein